MSSESPAPGGTGNRTLTFIRHPRLRWLARGLWLLAILYGLLLYVAAFVIFMALLPVARLGIGADYIPPAAHYVLNFSEDSSAVAAGIKHGDVLIAVNGIPAARAEALRLPPFDYLPYQGKVKFTVQTGDRSPRTVELTALKPFHALTRSLVQDFGMPHGLAMGIVLVFDILTVAAFWALSLLVMWRRHDDWMAILFSVVIFWCGVRLNTAFDTVIQFDSFLPARYISTFASLLIVLVAAFFLLFPTGRFSSRLIPVVLVMIVLWELLGTHILRPTDANIGSIVQYVALLIMILLVAQRYRTEFNRIQRQQTKWVIIGLTVTVTGFYLTVVSWRAFVGTNPLTDMAFILLAIRRLAVLTAPVTLAFAFFRYRLYDVDLVLNRGLVYGTLTLTLALVFGLVVLLVRALLRSITGSEESLVGLLLAAMVCGALFQPVRRRLQDVIDRRLFKLRRNLDDLAARRPTDIQPAQPKERGILSDTHIDGYRTGNLLGRGGMGEVYLAQHIETGEPAAVKILPTELSLDPEFLLRFQRESSTVAGLRHRSIIQIFKAGVVDGVHYIAMQYVEGVDLRSYLKQKQKLTLDEVRAIMVDVAAALDYAHKCGVVHRDIKPANIMLPTSGATNAILMDFGIAHIEQEGTRLTQSNIMATLDYASPEQLLSIAAIDGRADIYALGATIYQALTGETPFKGGAGQLVFAHIQKPPPDPTEKIPELSPGAAKAIMKAMAKKPEDRFQTAADFIEALAG